MQDYSIAVIPGDGVGREVIPTALTILKAAAKDVKFFFQEFDWGCDYYLKTRQMMPENGLDQLKPHDAVLLGAIGHPSVPDHISLREFLLRIRIGFDLYINLRSVAILPGLKSPLRGKGADHINMLFVRENTEGEYSGLGGRFKRGTEDEVAIQEAVFTRRGTERVIRFAFDQARLRPRKLLASATKSNAMQYSMVLWDEILGEMACRYPDVSVKSYHIDALCARMIAHPEDLDVIVASNLFGDILTDLGAALQGGLGLAASANLNPTTHIGPPMFEPVHGSAPDIAGRGIANPIAAIWATVLMMEHFGELAVAGRIFDALKAVTAEERVRTPDLGGNSTTTEFMEAVLDEVKR